MRHTRRTILAAATSAALLFVAACDSGSDSNKPAPNGEIVIGFASSTLTNPFFLQLKEGVEQAQAEFGVRVVFMDANNDVTTQLTQVQSLISQRVKAILLNPVDTQQSGKMAAAAETARIPLVAVDRAVTGGRVISEVSSDNVQGGVDAAAALAKATGPGEVLHLQGLLGTSASRDRGEGFQQGLALRSSVRIAEQKSADFDRARGMAVTAQMLTAKPNVKGLFAENDDMALGAVQALGDKAGNEVKVVGFDGTPEALAAVNSGKLAATIAQQPKELGRQAVEQAVKYLRGETVRNLIEIPVRVVTKANVQEFLTTS
ncbi:ABC-type sugar transport system substrate-binding protein [Crossiella equi]|uniref:ABC-type sugar transport system substrate-binding protein n=1 Tax=Crossiella equi TaxID=130796 RepID=A0ABS5AG49_9PSEU|nr:substrate-binding domain-containing protein [Crossiella equi]MBP2475563.1 ABC-type sugar transport system substrate-binding protein [Crossiella equi]